MWELPESLSIRAFRLDAAYTAARLNAQDDTRRFARDFEEAADKFALLEAEEAQLGIQRVETEASVETADDAWDDTMRAFQRRLLDLSGNSTDAELYRRYFSEIPSHVTSLSHPAEIMISRELEQALEHEEQPELKAFGERLRSKRAPLEAILAERTRLEVEEARFANRVFLAKAILNKLRRALYANLDELAAAQGRSRDWSHRFFRHPNGSMRPEAASRVEVPEVVESPIATEVPERGSQLS